LAQRSTSGAEIAGGDATAAGGPAVLRQFDARIEEAVEVWRTAIAWRGLDVFRGLAGFLERDNRIEEAFQEGMGQAVSGIGKRARIWPRHR